jgi:hypothetical protein
MLALGRAVPLRPAVGAWTFGSLMNTVHRLNRPAVLGFTVLLTGFGVGVILASQLDPGGSATSRTVTIHVARVRPAPAAPQASIAVLASNAQSSFATLERKLQPGGRIELAVAAVSGGPVETFGGDQPTSAKSMIAAPLFAALLHAGNQVSAPTAQAAIAGGDSGSTAALFRALVRVRNGLPEAKAAVRSELRASQDMTTTVAPDPGATQWSPSGSVKFIRALAAGCLLDRSQTQSMLSEMSASRFAEGWGLAQIRAASGSVAYISGWGPEPGGGYVVRQAGIIGSGASGVAVSMIARPTGGAPYNGGTTMLISLAQWLRGQLQPSLQAGQASCARTN